MRSTAHVFWSATMIPPEPRMAPASRISSKSWRMVRLLGAEDAAQGPAGLKELQILTSWGASPNVIDYLGQG